MAALPPHEHFEFFPERRPFRSEWYRTHSRSSRSPAYCSAERFRIRRLLGVLDHLPLSSAAPNYVNMTAPSKPFLAWTLVFDDATLTWTVTPRGSSDIGTIMCSLLLSIPIITGTITVLIFMWSFYGIRYNQFGVKPTKEAKYLPIIGAPTGKEDKEKGDGHTFSEKMSVGHSKNRLLAGQGTRTREGGS